MSANRSNHVIKIICDIWGISYHKTSLFVKNTSVSMQFKLEYGLSSHNIKLSLIHFDDKLVP